MRRVVDENTQIYFKTNFYGDLASWHHISSIESIIPHHVKNNDR